jgi:hypothetical protein
MRVRFVDPFERGGGTRSAAALVEPAAPAR